MALTGFSTSFRLDSNVLHVRLTRSFLRISGYRCKVSPQQIIRADLLDYVPKFHEGSSLLILWPSELQIIQWCRYPGWICLLEAINNMVDQQSCFNIKMPRCFCFCIDSSSPSWRHCTEYFLLSINLQSSHTWMRPDSQLTGLRILS